MPASAHSSVSARHLAWPGNMPVGLCGALTTIKRGAGDLGQALVARPGHDRVVARPDDDVQEAEDRLLCAGEDEDLVRADRVIERGDLRPQEGMPARLGITQAQAL